METVEKSFKGSGSSLSDFSISSHSAWKTLRKKQKRGEFPTVPTASAAAFNLGRETGGNLLREVARNRNLSWEAHRASETWLAAKKMHSQPAKEKFFLDSPLS